MMHLHNKGVPQAGHKSLFPCNKSAKYISALRISGGWCGYNIIIQYFYDRSTGNRLKKCK